MKYYPDFNSKSFKELLFSHENHSKVAYELWDDGQNYLRRLNKQIPAHSNKKTWDEFEKWATHGRDKLHWAGAHSILSVQYSWHTDGKWIKDRYFGKDYEGKL